MELLNDKSWMSIGNRIDPRYIDGVNRFLDYACGNSILTDQIIHCPCKKCTNARMYKRDEVIKCLIMYGILKEYTTWTKHGEKKCRAIPSDTSQSTAGHDMLRDAFEMGRAVNEEEVFESAGPNADAKKFFELLKKAEQPLYPKCTSFTTFSFIVEIFHLQCLNGWTNKSMNQLIEVLKRAFPEDETLPDTFYKAKKMITDLGLEYKKIDACPNDCMLYWREFAEDTVCKRCGHSRWKTDDMKKNNLEVSTCNKYKKIPAKVLRCFPIIPRLQWLYMSSKTTDDMTWHHKKRKDDGLLRHPTDSQAWKDLDNMFPSFDKRFGLVPNIMKAFIKLLMCFDGAFK